MPIVATVLALEHGNTYVNGHHRDRRARPVAKYQAALQKSKPTRIALGAPLMASTWQRQRVAISCGSAKTPCLEMARIMKYRQQNNEERKLYSSALASWRGLSSACQSCGEIIMPIINLLFSLFFKMALLADIENRHIRRVRNIHQACVRKASEKKASAAVTLLKCVVG